MPAGRPTDYKPEYCDLLIEHMAKGLSYESFAGRLRICRDTLYNWEKLFPDFSYSKRVGKEASLLLFEELAINGAMGKIDGFNASMCIFIMKNRHGYRDKTEIEAGPETRKTLKLAYSLDDEE